MSSTVEVPAITNDADIVASSDEDILSLYWNKATGELKGKTGAAGDILEFTSTAIKQVQISIPTAEVLQLFTTPKQLIAAPGAGFAIVVIEASTEIIFAGSQYITNVQLKTITDTATRGQNLDSQILTSTVSRIGSMASINLTAASDKQIIEDKALMLSMNTGNPVGGDSNIIVRLTYRLISV